MRKASGSVFYLYTNVVSKDVTATAVNLTDPVANGRLEIEDIILTTSYGMVSAQGTLRIIKNGGGGTNVILQVGIPHLGSNRTVNIASQQARVANWTIGSTGDYSRDIDMWLSRPTILDQTYRLQVDQIGPVATGANNGTIRVLIKARRIDDNATTSITGAAALEVGE